MNNHLEVAIINKNHVEGKINESSWNEFHGFFLESILTFLESDRRRLPFYEFCGLENGVRWITCGDYESLLFLKRSLQHYNSCSNYTFLSVAREKIPKWKKYSVFVTIYSEYETFEHQKSILIHTNSHIGSENWFFHPSVNTEAPISVNSRVPIFVSLNDTDELRLKEVNCYVYYGLEKIKMYKVANENYN